MATNYVKFKRGTQALYDALLVKDSNTLYFVYEATDAGKGKLYLGNKLISGSSSNIEGTISLSDISDILLSEGLSDGNVLVYDEVEKKWVNKTITEALSVATMIGATSTDDGESGLVPVPTKGSQGKFLRGDGTWATVEAVLSDEDKASIEDLKKSVSTLVGTDVDKSVAQITSEKVAELLIPDNAKESLDTLEEIAAWIQSHPDDAAAMNQSISDLTTVVNGDNGLVTRVTNLENAVGDLTEITTNFVTVQSALTDLNSSVTEINDRLTWHELDEGN
jgi:hypothetical protein